MAKMGSALHYCKDKMRLCFQMEKVSSNRHRNVSCRFLTLNDLRVPS
jgi:hypothetical protein